MFLSTVSDLRTCVVVIRIANTIATRQGIATGQTYYALSVCILRALRHNFASTIKKNCLVNFMILRQLGALLQSAVIDYSSG